MEKEFNKEDYRLRVIHDSSPMNPFKEWDCEPPVIYSSGRDGGEDFSKGDILSFIQKKATDGVVIRHQNKLAEILDINLQYFKDYSFSKDDKISDIISAFKDAGIKELSQLCGLFKIPHLRHDSKGYSQGDWAEVLIVLTDDFFETTGCERKNSKEILKGTAGLFDAWAYGDTFGFVLEKKKEYVQIPKDEFEVGNYDNKEENIEWEEHDSCWGFFGRDIKTNGIKDHLPEGLKVLADEFENEKIEYPR